MTIMKEVIKAKSVQSCNPFKSVIQTSYDIVKAHGGEISVDSTPSIGTIFILTIPADS